MNPFGPMMHQFSGVHFDIVSMCSHGDKCVNATGMFEFSKAEKLRYRSWKYNWDMDVEIDIDSILDFVRAGDQAENVDTPPRAAKHHYTRLNPFKLKCDPLDL